MSTASQVEHVVATRGPTLALVLAVVGVVALAGSGWLLVNPPTEQVTDQRATQTFGSDVTTSAVVTGDTPLYATGTELTDRPLYLLAAAPNATYTVETQVPAETPVEVSQSLVLVLQGTKDGEEFWRSERVLLNDTRRVDGATAEAATTVNMSAVEERLSDARTAVGEVGVFRASLQLRVDYRSDRYAGTLNASAPLQISSRAYWVDGDLAAEETRAQTVTRTVTHSPDPLFVGGLAVVGFGAVFGAGGIAMFYRRLDPETVEVRTARTRYEEWISDGEFPSGPDKRYIRINSLEDLVDVAIDSNKRVIYDDVYEAYAVADGDLVYYFTDDPSRIEPWLNM